MRLLRRLRAIWCLAESHNCNARLAGASTDDYRSTALHMECRDFGNPSSCCNCITLPVPQPFLFLQSRDSSSSSRSSLFSSAHCLCLYTSQAQIDTPEHPRARRWRIVTVSSPATGISTVHGQVFSSSSTYNKVADTTAGRYCSNDGYASRESRFSRGRKSEFDSAPLALTELAVQVSMHGARVLLCLSAHLLIAMFRTGNHQSDIERGRQGDS